MKITSEAGVEERRYGKLGEVVQETKTVSSATQGQSANSPEVYTTQYDFDTFGRLMTLTLPDGETITNAYDSGGNLDRIEGDKRGDHTVYLQSLLYDKFEQRTYLKLGNGVETRYTYRADNRRLANLKSEGALAGRFQNLNYTYDAVGNITDLANDVAIPPASSMGGPTASHFGYDDLYRLVHADGSYQSSPNKEQAYTLDLSYDAIHNITSKIQNDAITSNGGKPVAQKATSYNWAYAYAGAQPHAPSHIGDRSFFYDANGNQTGWANDKNGTRRSILWDEENRIQEIDDNGRATRFKYDDQGQRVFKIGEQGETVYVNQFYVVRNRSIVSKHVFAGTSRIATKLVGGTGNTRVPAPGASAQGNAYGPTQNKGQGNAYGRDKQAQGGGDFPGQGLEHRSEVANEHAQNTEKNPHFTGTLPGQGLANRSARANEVSRNVQQNPNLASATITDSTGSPGGSDWKPEGNFLYFYHPDHLGSTGFVTDGNGKLYEHIEYFPFGETWVQEHSNTLRTPYLFTGKELDQETGLYYFGARYYDPRTSVWQSADPVLEKYLPSGNKERDATLPGMGGVFNPPNLGLYSYSHLSPVNYVDPDGRWASQKGFYVHQRATFLVIGQYLPDPYSPSGYNAVLASAHVYADSGQFQSGQYAYRHAMRTTGQSVEQARAKANAFVREQFRKAWALKAAGKEKEGLFEFGVGLHTLQDSTSPSHHGFQLWTGHESRKEEAQHVSQELIEPGSGSELHRITKDAWGWYKGGQLPEGDLFKDYGADNQKMDRPQNAEPAIVLPALAGC